MISRRKLHKITRDYGAAELAQLGAWVAAKRQALDRGQGLLELEVLPTKPGALFAAAYVVRLPADVFNVADLGRTFGNVPVLKGIEVSWEMPVGKDDEGYPAYDGATSGYLFDGRETKPIAYELYATDEGVVEMTIKFRQEAPTSVKVHVDRRASPLLNKDP